MLSAIQIGHAKSVYSAIGRYHAWQGAWYRVHGRAVLSREALITSDDPGV